MYVPDAPYIKVAERTGENYFSYNYWCKEIGFEDDEEEYEDE